MKLYWAIAAILVAAAVGQVKVRRPSRRREGAAARGDGTRAVREQEDKSKKVVCYYTNWSVYRKGLAKFTPQNINPYLCTHLIYAFGGLTDEFTIKPFDSYQDIEQGGYAKFNGLKQYNPKLKTLLAIGGWNEGSGRFSELVELPENRKIFVNSAIKHLRRYNFDGLDLDWEYPASRTGSTPEDRENYAALVKELREAFNQEGRKIKKGRLLLTMAVPAGQNYIDKGYDIPSLTRDLDFFNILNYDYHSAYEPQVNHHAALMTAPGTSEYELDAPLNVDWTIKYYLEKGADAHKLVMGIPSYGRSFTLIDGQFTDMGASADGPGVEGKYTKEKGYLAFYEVCELIASDGWQTALPFPRRIGPYAYKGNQWVGYDDEHIVKKKAEYVRDNNLGGIMFWSLDSEDFRGLCNGVEYPLIEAGKKALFAESETSGNTLNSPLAISTITTTTSRPSLRPRPGTRKQQHQQSQAQTTYNPLSTPAPPTTPSPVSGFKCRREGFFPNDADCHKYHWCLDSGASGLGIVAHLFTCPSDLVFNKAIDGCDHPSSAKCKQREPNRGGAGGNVQATSTPFPRTTETIPNYDYEKNYEEYGDYYYDDDYYYDNAYYYDESPAKDTSNAAVPSRNSGGSQFTKTNEAAADTKTSTGNKNNIRYSSISRDRTQAAADVVEAAPEVGSEQSNAPGRKYTNIQRQRPTVTESPIEDATSASQPGRRTYSSIDRNRPATEAAAEDETGTTQSSGREYVTLKRNRPQLSPANPSPSTNQSPQSPDSSSKDRNQGRVYTSIQRNERPISKVESENSQITEVGSLSRISNTDREYTSIRRPRPQSLSESSSNDKILKQNDQDQVYTTIQRTRPQSSEIQPSDTISPTDVTAVDDISSKNPVPEITSIRRKINPGKRPQGIRPLRPRPETSDSTSPTDENVKKITIQIPEIEPSDSISPTDVTTVDDISSKNPVPEITPIRRKINPGIRPQGIRPLRPRPGSSDGPSETRYVTLSRNRAQAAEENIQTTTEESTTEVSITVKQESSGLILLTLQDLTTESPATEEPQVVRIRTRPPPTPTRPRPTPPPTVSKPRPTRPRPTRPRSTRPPTTPSTTTTSTTTTTTTTTTTPIPEVDTLAPEKPLEDEILYEDYYVDEFIPETTAQPEVSVRPTIRSLISRTKAPVTESSPRIPATRVTTKPRVSVRPRPAPRPRPSLGSRTTSITTTPRPRPPPRSPRPPRTTTPRPQSLDYEFEYDWDYYDTLTGSLGGTLGQLAVVQDKAILKADGSVICYDTGYFSHPESCKKFISCSKTVRGVVRGWVYTCPDRLVFDPVGGMCNWAEAVDCVAR